MIRRERNKGGWRSRDGPDQRRMRSRWSPGSTMDSEEGRRLRSATQWVVEWPLGKAAQEARGWRWRIFGRDRRKRVAKGPSCDSSCVGGSPAKIEERGLLRDHHMTPCGYLERIDVYAPEEKG